MLYADGAERPKMLSVGLHCRISGRPARTAALARFLDYVKQHDDAWVCRRSDIAQHWRNVHPYDGDRVDAGARTKSGKPEVE